MVATRGSYPKVATIAANNQLRQVSLSETNHPQFKGIASKKRGELLLILQQIKDIHSGIDNSEMVRWFERKTDSNKFKYKDA